MMFIICRRTSSFAKLIELLEEQQRRFQGVLRRCHQLMVEDPSLTENVRFLNVLESKP